MKRQDSPLPELLKKESKPTWKGLATRYATFVLSVVLLAVGVNRFFNWAAIEKPDPQALFMQITDGRVEMRRMAAIEWVRQLQATDGPALQALQPNAEHLRILGNDFVRSAECQGQDPLLMSSLAAWLGYATDANEARRLLQIFLTALPEGSCLESRVMALSSLVRLGADPSDLPYFLGAAIHADPSVRKVASFALGRMQNGAGGLAPDAEVRLKTLLQDPAEDVRWNAAIALAPQAPSDAIPYLKPLLAQAESRSQLSPREFELYREVMKASLATRDPELRVQVERMSMRHSHLKLRQAAKEILR